MQREDVGEFDYDHDPDWRIFRIMAEFVDGFNFLSNYKRTVTFFGSARLPQDHPAAKKATQLAKMLGEAGCTVVTGGGPGIMEAANHGGNEAGMPSIGLNIQLPMEQRSNKYVTAGMGFHHFYTRKVMLAFSAEAYVYFPGGFGTADELFEMITLLQTKKIEEHIPVVLIDSNFWTPMVEWMKQTMYEEYKTIDARDLNIFHVTDDIDEAFSIIKKALPRRRVNLKHT